MATSKSKLAGRSHKLPTGMWLRGRTYYARFKKNGRLIRKRLSTDYRVACQMLNDLKARTDRADFEILGHSTLNLTMGIYTKATDRAKRDAITALPFAKASQPKHVVSIPSTEGAQKGEQVSLTSTKRRKNSGFLT